MAKRRARPQAGGGGGRGRGGSGGGGAGRLVLGFVLGGAAACAAGYLYLHGRDREPAPAMSSESAGTQPGTAMPRGAGPVATPKAVSRQPPFGSSEEVFEGGARVYAARCASCHGTPRKEAHGRVRSPQIFGGEGKGLSARAPGEVYREIAEGAPGKGMPAYAGVLTETQLWQLTLLLESAGQPLPDPVVAILNR